jgi:hypothetical protein
MIDLLAGRVRRIIVHVREREIPADLVGGDYESDPACRERFQAWVNGIWAEKDAVLAEVLGGAAGTAGVEGPGHRAQGPEQRK